MKIERSWITESIVGHFKNFEFYPNSNGRSLKTFKKGSCVNCWAFERPLIRHEECIWGERVCSERPVWKSHLNSRQEMMVVCTRMIDRETEVWKVKIYLGGEIKRNDWMWNLKEKSEQDWQSQFRLKPQVVIFSVILLFFLLPVRFKTIKNNFEGQLFSI